MGWKKWLVILIFLLSGCSLYKDEKTAETVEDVFSGIFTTIAELNH